MSDATPGLAYTCEVALAVPRHRVLELMSDPERSAEWTPGLAGTRQLKGEPGQPGSVRELSFEGMPGPGGPQAMIEQTERLDDEHYHLVYLLGPVRNVARNTFHDASVDGAPGTRWVAEQEFFLPPGMAEGLGEQGRAAFVANTQGAMEHFKRWCEANA